jgi:bifunctional non-homologous end joining protein LigD
MMQATKGTVADIARLQGAEWLFDLKLDGIRAVATVRRGQVTLQSRNETISSRYPEIVTALQEKFPAGDVVLDGEFVVIGEDGYPSWE